MAAISFPSSLLCRDLSAEAFSAVFYMDARASHSPEKHSAAESPWPPSEVNIVDVCSGRAQMHGAHNFWLVPKPTNITLAHTKGLLLQVVCRHTSLSGMVSALHWVFIMQELPPVKMLLCHSHYWRAGTRGNTLPPSLFHLYSSILFMNVFLLSKTFYQFNWISYILISYSTIGGGKKWFRWLLREGSRAKNHSSDVPAPFPLA